jgi:hypothetical protein
MLKNRRIRIGLCLAALIAAVPLSFAGAQGPLGIFPHKNFWTKITPSIVWCGDTQNPVTIEVHIVGRTDVRKLWMVNLNAVPGEPALEAFPDSSKGLQFYDDGTHGDPSAGDFVFSHGGLVLPCELEKLPQRGWFSFWGYVRVELADGTRLGDSYGSNAGWVDPKYKGTFAVKDLGDGLSATAYGLFIQDIQHEVIDNYPVANVYCGTGNYNAYRKLYKVFPDVFDFAMVKPGMQIFRPKDFNENVPYDILVTNSIQHIGLEPYDHAAEFGSAGKLKSVVYQDFTDVSVYAHELGHSWGMHLGSALGLSQDPNSQLGHWNGLSDIYGQMGSGYPNADGAYGMFRDNGDGTWSWLSGTTLRPFAPLELYAMGLIPAEEVTPVHILQSPDLSDPLRVTAAGFQTITIEQILQAEGGKRTPAAAESQKDFKLAFIVTQDAPFTDAAYAFFSLQSALLMSKGQPDEAMYFTPFYWATGGRATLDSRLPLDLPEPVGLPGAATPTSRPTVETVESTNESTIPATPIDSPESPTGAPTAAVNPTAQGSGTPLCNFPLIVGGLAILPGAWVAMQRKEKKARRI